MMWQRSIYTTLLLLACAGWTAAGDDRGANWPGFRGPQARGVVEGPPTPVEWNAETGDNIKWKTAIPGLAHSAPAIWGDRLFVTTAITGKKDAELKVGLYGDIGSVKDDTVHKFELYALNKKTGEILWQRTAHEGVPEIKRHTKASHANCSPATDGKHVIAFFGSEGLYAYDMNGKLLWKKDLGLLDAGYYVVPKAQWGFGSSPIIHEDKVIVQVDIQKGSFLAAYSLKDGSEIWKTPRDEVPTWSTPTVHDDGSRVQVITNGWKQIGGYDVETGKELWRMKGAGDIPTPTPYVAGGLIFLTSAHGGGRPVYAIKTSAKGDISLADGETSNEYVAWSDLRGGSYMPTTVVYRDLLYILRDNGVLSCRDAATGKLHYQERLGSGSTGYTASLVAADGKIYATAETGEIRVVKAGRELEVLAENPMGEICMATPAISDGTLFFRTRDHVVAVADD